MNDKYLERLTEFRSKCFDMANSGKYGEYPLDLEAFNEEVEAGFGVSGETWYANDGTKVTINNYSQI